MLVKTAGETQELFGKINEMVLVKCESVKPDISAYDCRSVFEECNDLEEKFVQVYYKDIISSDNQEMVLVHMTIDKFLEFVPAYRGYNDILMESQQQVLEYVQDTINPVDFESYLYNNVVGEDLGFCYMRHRLTSKLDK